MKLILRALIIVSSLLLLVSIQVSSRGIQEELQKTEDLPFRPTDALPLDPKVRRGMLDNGMAYYIRENSRPENRVILRLALDAGSILEDKDQLGLAHFTEHMAFNGTKHFEENELIEYLESIGMKFGPDINAHTGFDETVYKLTVPMNGEGHLETALRVLKDWAAHISFAPEEIDKERGVIVEEWRTGRGAQARMRDEYFPVLFKDSRYAERLPIGDMDIVRTFDYPVIRRFYKDWYRPDLMALIAVGDFDSSEIESKIRSYFSDFSGPENPRKRVEYPVPDHRGTLYSIHTDPEAANTFVDIIYKHDINQIHSYNDYKKLILERLYNTMFNQRLAEIEEEADPPFIMAYSTMANFVRTKAVYELSAVVSEDKIENAGYRLLLEAERLKRFGFTEEELKRSKSEILSSMERYYNERNKLESISFANEYVRHYLDDEPAPGLELEYELFKTYLPEIGLEEVNALADDLITEDNRMILVRAPEKEGLEVPDIKDLKTIIEKAGNAEIEPYQEDEVAERLIEEHPPNGEITRRIEYPRLDMEVWELSNGAKVVLKPTDFKNDLIVLQAFSPGGTSLVTDSEYVSAQFAAPIVSLSGIDGMDYSELRKFLAGKRVSISPYISNLKEGFSGSSSVEDIELLFQLIYLYFTDFRRDSDAFSSYKSRIRGLIENRKAQPEALFQDTIQRLISKDHFRRRPLSKELLNELEESEVYEIFAERFKTAEDFTFVFVGSFARETMEPLVRRYLASIPRIGRDESWKDRNIEEPKEKVTEYVYKGIEPKSAVALIYHGDYSWGRKENYLLQSLAELVNIRLREKIREEEGGTYGVGVYTNLSDYPEDEYKFNIVFMCDPSRAEQLSDAVLEEIETIQEGGLDQSYAERVKEIQRKQREENLKENSFWAGALEEGFFHNQAPETILEYDDLVDSLSMDEIKITAEKYLENDRYVHVILFPEEFEEKKQ